MEMNIINDTDDDCELNGPVDDVAHSEETTLVLRLYTGFSSSLFQKKN